MAETESRVVVNKPHHHIVYINDQIRLTLKLNLVKFG